MENLLRQLERQEGLMSHIQKALGEYLEGQRQVTHGRLCCLFCLRMMEFLGPSGNFAGWV